MTSVTCSACAHKIKEETDRVYCFGGCEQILHTRCSELKTSVATALRDNVALKYVCFDCRKQLTCINKIHNLCSDLMERVDALSTVVLKNEAAFSRFENDFSQRIENSLLPRLLSMLDARLSAASFASHITRNDNTNIVTTRGSKAAKRTYADVAAETGVGSKTKTVDVEEDGLLRSGKRRKIPSQTDHAAVNNNANVFMVSNTENNSATRDERNKIATPRKSGTVVKIEQTVLIKPKLAQNPDVTKSDIRENIDPVAFCVKAVRYKEDGEAAVRCESKQCALKLVEAASNILTDKYDITILKPLKPRVKIFGLSDTLSADEILDKLKKQNNLPDSADVKVIRLLKNDNRLTGAVLETDAVTFDCLINRQRVNVGWDRCKVVEEINVNRCYNCTEFGHKAANCEKPMCCPKCAGDHKANDCKSDFEKCANCDRANKQRESTLDEVVDINHSAWSRECPIFKRRARNARLKIDYSV